MTSTYRIQETAPLIQRFALGNYKKPLISILPYIIGVNFVAEIMAHNSPMLALPFILLSALFSLMFAAHIHRAYIASQSTERFNPLQPTKADWQFIIAYLLLALIPAGFGFAAGFIGGMLGGQAGSVILTIISIPVSIFIMTRCSLILPDRAVGGTMRIKDSYRISQGLVWKIILAPLLASWKYILAAIGWTILSGIVAGMMVDDKDSLMHSLAFFVIQAPVSFGLSFIIAAIMVAGLSNYYLWARQNQGR